MLYLLRIVVVDVVLEELGFKRAAYGFAAKVSTRDQFIILRTVVLVVSLLIELLEVLVLSIGCSWSQDIALIHGRVWFYR